MRPLLKVSNVSRDFVKSLDVVAKFLNRLGQSYKEEIVHAVDDVSFEVFKGEVSVLLVNQDVVNLLWAR